MSQLRVLIYEKNIHRASELRRVIEQSGNEVTTVFYPEEAGKVASRKKFDVVIAGFDSFPVPSSVGDIKMIISAPDNRYLEVDRLAREHGSLCVTYPYDAEHLLTQIERAAKSVPESGAEAETGLPDTGILGDSSAIRKLRETIRTAAQIPSSVLILGDTGTGKELAAHALHNLGPRKKFPFVAINCGALTETLLEAELFGHEKGAFTGAHKKKEGKFESAHRGTLFLDEIGDMPQSLQVKLLRVLESGSFYRVGGEKPVTVDVRIVCATNRDIFQLAQTGGFRKDLFYRINVIMLSMPLLRERSDDIPLLARHFLKTYSRDFNKPLNGFSAKVLAQMQGHPWPGNVRQLQNSVERAVFMEKGKLISNIDYGYEPALPSGVPPDMEGLHKKDFAGMQTEVLAYYEKEYLVTVLKEVGGSIQKACDRCRMDRKTIYTKMKLYGLDKKDFR